ncbi:MAG: ABC transporter ATP-binding protein [Eubacterium sp.]|nr:ABC transporter ATP-binding protein [Eubacterium sp.]
MKPENAIEVKNITKKFKIYLDKGYTLKEKALFKKRRRYEERSVLNGVSFSVKKGEAVGLIGHNGCGKSTTLKLLTKIMYPDSGTVEMQGRVSSLLELGAGFHPDMSGRENIYINASIFGLSRKEIDRRAGEMIAFSELEEFIDNPVRTYSSGMYMRLAFAVAIHVDADILLIDEILAVGDASFQSKCFRRLREIKQEGTTIVLVSHSLDQIEKICDRTIWLHEGLVRLDGKPADVHLAYMDYMMEKEEKKQEQTCKNSSHRARYKETGTQKAIFESIRLLDEHLKNEKKEFQPGDAFVLEAEYSRKDNSIRDAEIGVQIVRDDGVCCMGTNTQVDRVESVQLKDQGIIQIYFYDMPFVRGRYSFTLTLRNYADEIYHRVFEAARFWVKSNKEEFGVVSVKHQWNFDGKEAAAETGKCLDTEKTKVQILAEKKQYEVRAGENLQCKVNITNLSEQDICPDRFYPVSLSYHLYKESGELVCFEGKRTCLYEGISRDVTKEICVQVVTQGLSAGSYYADLMLVQENVAWFGDTDSSMKERIMLYVKESSEAGHPL